MNMNMLGILLPAGGGVLAYVVAKFLLRQDDSVEDRRKIAIRLSAKCTANGLPILSSFLENYAVGGYQELYRGGKEILAIVADDEKLNEVVNRFLTLQLNKKFNSAEGREIVLSIIEAKLNITIPRNALAKPATELKVS